LQQRVENLPRDDDQRRGQRQDEHHPQIFFGKCARIERITRVEINHRQHRGDANQRAADRAAPA